MKLFTTDVPVAHLKPDVLFPHSNPHQWGKLYIKSLKETSGFTVQTPKPGYSLRQSEKKSGIMEQIIRKNLHPLYAKTYTLNKSRTKKISVGLEYNDDSMNLTPAIRFADKESVGIKINLDEWDKLKKMFGNIEQYLEGGCDQLRDSEYHGSSWKMKFTFSHFDRAISIQEVLNNTHRPFGVLVTPTYQQNLVFKKVTFDTLKQHVVKLVDKHLDQLKLIADATTRMVKKVVDYVALQASMQNDAQIQVFKPSHVRSYTSSFSDEAAKKLEIAMTEEGLPLSQEVIYILFFEIASLHAEYVAYLLSV